MFHCLSCDSIAAQRKIRHDKISLIIHHFIKRFCHDSIISQTEDMYLCILNGQKHKVDVSLTIEGVKYYLDVSIFTIVVVPQMLELTLILL